jgi:hypothetical protein
VKGLLGENFEYFSNGWVFFGIEKIWDVLFCFSWLEPVHIGGSGLFCVLFFEMLDIDDREFQRPMDRRQSEFYIYPHCLHLEWPAPPRDGDLRLFPLPLIMGPF